MPESSDVLATFFGDESFPIEWESEEEKELFWWFDDLHCLHPLSPMFWSLSGWWGPTLEYMYRRFGFPVGIGWIGKRVNGYLYSAVVPRPAEEAGKIGPYYGMVMGTYAESFLDWWQGRYLPEILAGWEYLDTFDTEAATLPELMVYLEEAIDIQERAFRIHWILNLAQFQSSMDFQAAVGEVVGEIDPTIVARILISNKDRNWDSLEDMWKLKEKVKKSPELTALFDAGDTAAAILPALKASPAGQAFLDEDVQPHAQEYGVKSPYPHEYIYKLWVEDVTPIVETIKGYLASGYDFPTQFQKTLDDQAAAIEELRALVPETATDEQTAFLEHKMALAVKMMPLTPDHHFYIDQGTFGRLRLVLMVIGRKMVEMGLLDNPDDIMFLEYEQLRYYAGNPKSEENPDGYDGRSLAKQGRRDYEAAFKIRPRSWIGTVTHWGMYEEPYHTLWGYPQRFEKEQAGVETTNVVTGLPASHGIVEGPARVVITTDEFDEVRAGEIVVCVVTNPAWVVLFTKIIGLVTDTGGVLAHPGVVAREFGIPAVVGTGDATQAIKTGDRIRVDGNSGKVEILA